MVLVQTRTGLDLKHVSVSLPQATLHVAAGLDKYGYRVTLIDQRIDKQWQKNLHHALADNPLFVGISAMTGTQIKNGLSASALVKAFNPEIPVIWGGVHPSLLPEQTIQNKYTDIVVIGEGDKVIVDIAKHLEEKSHLEDIQGICYKNDGKRVISTPKRDLIDLNSLPFLPYHLVNVRDYLFNLYNCIDTLNLLTGKGCPYHCGYCYNNAYNNGRWRGKNAERIVEEIEILVSFGAKTIDLVDDCFFADINRVKIMCDTLLKRSIKVNLTTNCRLDQIARFDFDFLKLLKRTGFIELFCGVESGSERVLKKINKGITLEEIMLANEKLKQVDIVPIYSFMGGFPGEALGDIKKTVNLMIKLIKENPDASMTSVKNYTPFPGTPLFELCVKEGFKPPSILEEWGRYEYSASNFNWGSRRDKSVLDKICYLTLFLDEKSTKRHFGKIWLIGFLVGIYSKIAKFRLRRNFYFFMPELIVLKGAKNIFNKMHV